MPDIVTTGGTKSLLAEQLARSLEGLRQEPVCAGILAESIPSYGGIELLFHRMLHRIFNHLAGASFQANIEQPLLGMELDFLFYCNDLATVQTMWAADKTEDDMLRLAAGFAEIKPMASPRGTPPSLSRRLLQPLINDIKRLRRLQHGAQQDGYGRKEVFAIVILPCFSLDSTTERDEVAIADWEIRFWQHQALQDIGITTDDLVVREYAHVATASPCLGELKGADTYVLALVINADAK